MFDCQIILSVSRNHCNPGVGVARRNDAQRKCTRGCPFDPHGLAKIAARLVHLAMSSSSWSFNDLTVAVQSMFVFLDYEWFAYQYPIRLGIFDCRPWYIHSKWHGHTYGHGCLALSPGDSKRSTWINNFGVSGIASYISTALSLTNAGQSSQVTTQFVRPLETYS